MRRRPARARAATHKSRRPRVARAEGISVSDAVREAITEHIDRKRQDKAFRERLQPDEQITQLEEALALFRGEPLAGIDYSWAAPPTFDSSVAGGSAS